MFKITEELLFKILILTAFVIYFYLSLQFPSIPMQEGYGAGLFPLIISVSFFLFAIKDFFTKNKEEFKNIRERLVEISNKLGISVTDFKKMVSRIQKCEKCSSVFFASRPCGYKDVRR